MPVGPPHPHQGGVIHTTTPAFPSITRDLGQNPSEGPLTQTYLIDAEKVRTTLDKALASELMAWSTYTAQAIAADGLKAETVRPELEEHAAQELAHAEMLAKRIDELGGMPDMNPMTIADRSIHPYEVGETVDEMLAIQLAAERRAVDFYRRAIQWIGDRDPTTRRMLEDILAVEEQHANDIAGLTQG